MKNLFKKIAVATFAVIVGSFVAMAWIEVENEITYSGISVRLKNDESSTLIISSSKTNSGDNVELEADTHLLEMSPCTTEDGKLFYDETGNKVTGSPYIVDKSFYIYSTVAGQQVKIDDVELTNGEQEIADALRVAVTVGNDTQIINPSEEDYGTTFGGDLALAVGSPNVANVKVYFEGTDEACIYENIDGMDEIGVALVLDAE